MLKKILCVLLSVLMVVSLLPMGVVADDSEVTVVATQTSTGTLSILSGADFTDESLYLYVNYTLDESDHVGWGAGAVCDSSWNGIVSVDVDSTGVLSVSLVDLAAQFESAGVSVSDGVILNWWGSDYATLISAQLVSVSTSSGGDSGNEEVLAANQELIATLSEILNTDEVMYIDQLGSNDDYGWYDYFLTVYYGEVHPNWDEIVASWISSLGDEANIGLAATVYKAPVEGTEDDPDGTDGLLTISYIADVGSAEDGTYVESDYYYVDVIIKATPYGAHSIYTNFDNSYGYAASDKDYAVAGEEVTVTVVCEYTISGIQVLYLNDEGEMCEVEYTDNGDGTYTFIMPDAYVWMNFFVDGNPINYVSIAYVYDWEQAQFDGVEYVDTAGDEVSFTMFARSGYELDGEVTAVDAVGNTVALTLQDTYTTTDNGETVTVYAYSFTAPECAVIISANFKAIETATPTPTPTHTHTTATVIENYVAATATTDGSYDSVTYCTECGEIISESHTVIAAYGTGSAEVIDWATVLAGANSSNATNTTVEDVVIEEPIEPTDTETEDDGEEEPAAEPVVETETPAETNPTTGVALSLIPMAIAALAVVSSKRR